MRFLRKMTYSALATLAIGALAMQANGEIVHVAKKGETIYGIANMYHITPDALLQANPQAQRGVKKGMSIIIPDGNSTPKTATPAPQKQMTPRTANIVAASAVYADTAKVASPEQKVAEVAEKLAHTQSLTYLSSSGDNFDKISRKTGVEAGELMELNPFLDPNDVPAGVLVRLSADAPLFDEKRAETPMLPTEEPVATSPIFNQPAEETLESAPAEVVAEAMEHRNILIMLPFMSEADKQSKKAQLYTDFYRGFLIAAKNNSESGNKDIDIVVSDTNDDLQVSRHDVSSLIHNDIAVIIAPEDHAQIQMLADSAASRGVYVLNMFSFTDDTYLSNPWVIQGNINQNLMYEKAIDAVMSEYPGYVPVILAAQNSREEKAPFTDALKQKYRENGLEIMDISFDEALEDSHLAALDPEKRYVFIPRSGSQTVFNRIAPTVLDLMEQEGGMDRYQLFGYPDWTAYRGESLALLQRLHATVYSRFACDEKDADNQHMQEEFISWYGEPMLEAVPSQALLGYDVANYLIEALRNGCFDGEFSSYPYSYRGLQSTFKFKKASPEGGFVNEALYLIEFMPDDRYSIKVL